jgi:fumarate reductase flavoprotein subunit
MQDAMEEGAGIYRDEEGLRQAADKIHALKERFRQVALDDTSRTFNTELISALELSNLLDLAEVILSSATARRESRGAHQRTDYPERDDDEFLAHTMARRSEDGTPSIEFEPVTITRWPPAERVYGR